MRSTLLIFFFFNDTATTEIYTLSLHDALPIYTREQAAIARAHLRDGGRRGAAEACRDWRRGRYRNRRSARSEEHTSELQSRLHLVCRLLLEKKKNQHHMHHNYASYIGQSTSAC